jgi:hypothetical protein
MSFMVLTVAIWGLSMIRLVVAGMLYWPLLCCHIRGNLKEYCCHKVDKRISQILIEKRKRRFDQKPEKKDLPDTESQDGKFQPTLPKVELDGDGDSIYSMPMYPLSRTNTADSRVGLLQRTDSSSTVGTQQYLTRTNTGISDPRSLARTNTEPEQRGLSRTNTDMTDRSFNRAPTLPRQPTLPHLVSDFSVPSRPPPTTPRSLPRLDTHMSPSRPPTSNSMRTAPTGYGPPPRSMTNQSLNSSQTAPPGYGPPPRSMTNDSMRSAPTGYGPPPRSMTNDSMRSAPPGHGPPSRSMTNQSLNSARTEPGVAPWQTRGGPNSTGYGASPRRPDMSFPSNAAYPERSYSNGYSPERPYQGNNRNEYPRGYPPR